MKSIKQFKQLSKEHAESAARNIFEKFINNSANKDWLNEIKYPGVHHKIYVVEKIAEIITTAIVNTKNHFDKIRLSNFRKRINPAIIQQKNPSGIGPEIHDIVARDIMERKKLGRLKYKEPLKAFNGHDPLIDAYQEILDLAVYLRQHIEEQMPMIQTLTDREAEEILNNKGLLLGPCKEADLGHHIHLFLEGAEYGWNLCKKHIDRYSESGNVPRRGWMQEEWGE